MTDRRITPTLATLSVFSMLSTAACDKAPAPQGADAAPPTAQSATEQPNVDGDLVSKASAIAREVATNPESAEAVLTKHSMSVDEFEAMMLKIAGDPVLATAFEKANPDLKSSP